MVTAEQKGKKPRTDGEGASDPIDAALLHSIEMLQEIQEEIDKVNEEACDKVLELEQKYNEVRRPIYVQRSTIIKEISDFWLTAFLSHPVIGELLTEDDQKIFKHLESIDVDESKDIKSGYSITLTFSPNPYFEDTKLTKAYSFSDDGSVKVKATSIKWKEGMDIVNDNAYMKKGDKRILIDESFFTWFDDKKNRSFAHGGMDEVADVIKEELWPNPLKYFNNEIEEFEPADDGIEIVPILMSWSSRKASMRVVSPDFFFTGP
ncbi:hypothetical protein GUJ93_ZPchr0014g47316 [Zizania palustris]|uniref:NAP1-related protein 2 n=1 Tax=Zizania palustris TaxID=103762 RepID=A0A8J5TH87_ZIZPA|nr:hypothetical protein GUJ93_ZPchr0014g47316 [Zizania palustris]